MIKKTIRAVSVILIIWMILYSAFSIGKSVGYNKCQNEYYEEYTNQSDEIDILAARVDSLKKTRKQNEIRRSN